MPHVIAAMGMVAPTAFVKVHHVGARASRYTPPSTVVHAPGCASPPNVVCAPLPHDLAVQ
jgi:hypothetical protein